MRALRQAVRILQAPEQEFRRIPGRTLEAIVVDYLALLVVCAAMAFVVSLAFSMGRAVYLDRVMLVDVYYWRMFNYAAGTAVSLFFFYIFAGTFLAFLASLLVRPFMRGLKYTAQLAVLLYAFSPLLLFSWIPALNPGLLVWAGVLLAFGLRQASSARTAVKNTIAERE